MTGDNGQMVRAEAWIFAAGHLSHGNPTRRAQRQPISYLTPARHGRPERSGGPSLAWRPDPQRLRARAGAPGVQRRAMSRLVALLALRRSASGGPSLTWDLDSRRPRGGAAGTQRRPISCLATQLAAPSIRVRAVAAGVQRRPMSRLVARLTESRRLRGGRGPDAAGR
eukprot:tig00020956_g16515.t4